MKRGLYHFLFCCAFASAFFVLGSVSAAEPEATQLISPEAGATVSQTPTFYWTDVTGADRYELWVGGQNWHITSGYSYYKVQSSEALNPGSNQWGVITCNADGCTESDVWAFTVVAGTPSAPQISSPCGQTNVSLTPTFNWSNVNADHYYVYISDFLPKISTFQTSLNLATADLGSLEFSKNYSWYVEACSKEEKCSKSSSCGFMTKSSTPTSNTPGSKTPSDNTNTTCGECQEGQICNPLAFCNIEDLINAIIGFLIKIGTPIAAIMFVIAGIVFVTSAGDPKRVLTARMIMIYTAVGLAVILIASGLIKVLQSLLGGS